jgi:hypothetical protein
MERLPVRMRFPPARLEVRVSRWHSAEDLVGERQPGEQTLL